MGQAPRLQVRRSPAKGWVCFVYGNAYPERQDGCFSCVFDGLKSSHVLMVPAEVRRFWEKGCCVFDTFVTWASEQV